MSEVPLETLGRFRTLLMDPPWETITYDRKKSVPSRGPDPYDTMSLDELKAMPIHAVTEDDAVLLMWIIDSHLDQSLELAAHHGFRFKTVGFIWDKGAMSFGHWTRKEAELCLLFTKGRPKRIGKGVRQIIREPKRQHSRKPDSQYHRVEDLVAGPYLELFGRKARPGWVSWGREAGLFDGRHMPTNRRLGPLLDGLDVTVVHDGG